MEFLHRMVPLLLLVAAACDAPDLETRDGAAAQPITIPLTIESARAALGTIFTPPYDSPPPRPRRAANFARLEWYGTTHALFPDDGELAREAAKNPPLRRYLAIDPGRRNQDLLLYRSAEHYWPSIYFDRGNAVPFGCSFLLHLEPAGSGATRVTAFEYQPVVRAGSRFGIGHGDIGRYATIRPVAPTAHDVQALLAFIAASVETRRTTTPPSPLPR
jgi:hypothetical protein